MKNILKVLLIFYFVGSHVNTAWGVNYYIDPHNGHMDNDGSFSSPWSRLDSVARFKQSLLTGGDTLFLRGGYHGHYVRLDRKFSTPVVVMAEKGHVPKLLNFTIAGEKWIVDGLTFTQEGSDGSGTPGSFYNGTHFTLTSTARGNIIRNSNFYSTQDASQWTLQDWRSNVWNAIIDYGRGNLIKNNRIRNIAFAIQLTRNCDSTVVEGNLIDNFSGDGIRIAGADYCRIENNIIKNSVELDANSSEGNHEDGIQAWDYDDGVNGLIVRGNFVLNYDNPDRPFKGLLQGIGFFDGFYNDCIIENNIIIVEHWHGISLYGARDCRIINNTVLPNPGGSSSAGPPWIGIFAHKDGRASTGNIVRNNLATSLKLDSGSATRDHNVIDLAAMDFCRDFGGFDFYPRADYTVNGKAIIDAGSSSLAPVFDYNGTARPQGPEYDIGAYEYSDSFATAIVSGKGRLPGGYRLVNNYPNPFNPVTTIQYFIARPGPATIWVYNALGQKIRTLAQGIHNRGSHTIVWDGRDSQGRNVSSGVYYYRLIADNFIITKKMILLR